MLVHRFYNLRRAALRAALRAVGSNAAHLALARRQRSLPGPGGVAIATRMQNVDEPRGLREFYLTD